jgi:V/A-type H+/Na+-transporting ATPase subunit E
MSLTKIKSGLSAIANEVLQDVGNEAQAIILEAQTQAKDTLKIAKENADQTYKTLLYEANIKTQAEKRRIESLTDVELRNRLLQTKETLVDSVFEKAAEKFNAFVKTDAYHDYLLRGITEAAEKLGSKNLAVRLNSTDKTWFTKDKLDSLSKKIQVNLKVEVKPENCMGGCIIQTTDGKLSYDNTIENRLQQLKPLLRLEVAKILFNKEAT